MLSHILMFGRPWRSQNSVSVVLRKWNYSGRFRVKSLLSLSCLINIYSFFYLFSYICSFLSQEEICLFFCGSLVASVTFCCTFSNDFLLHNFSLESPEEIQDVRSLQDVKENKEDFLFYHLKFAFITSLMCTFLILFSCTKRQKDTKVSYKMRLAFSNKLHPSALSFHNEKNGSDFPGENKSVKCSAHAAALFTCYCVFFFFCQYQCNSSDAPRQ